ncbi:uncharacterized protein V1516DRAFT_669758 [Lipomyces oligophaga]|uniref:uncharacterized protein n=1 Tax=Lipomyces oligophaga TaxID=45792 RepID=UPI0034CD7FA2
MDKIAFLSQIRNYVDLNYVANYEESSRGLTAKFPVLDVELDLSEAADMLGADIGRSRPFTQKKKYEAREEDLSSKEIPEEDGSIDTNIDKYLEQIRAFQTQRLIANGNSLSAYLQTEINTLKKQIHFEEALSNEMQITNKLLEERVYELRNAQNYNVNQNDTVEQMIGQLEKTKSEKESKLVSLMLSVRKLIDSEISQMLVSQETEDHVHSSRKRKNGRDSTSILNRQKEIAREAKLLLENLLNAEFDDRDPGWVPISDPDNAAVDLLIRSDLALLNPDDVKQIRLRDFSKAL